MRRHPIGAGWRMDLTGDLLDFAEAVGSEGVVAPVGGGTQWDATGAPGRVVRSPGGIVTYEPAEMTVRVRAGTTIAELAATLAEHGQMVPVVREGPLPPHGSGDHRGDHRC